MDGYAKLTSYQSGKPLWIRKDQIAAWFYDRGHYHIVPTYDEVDVEVKESGEEIFEIVTGEKQDGIQVRKDKPLRPRRN